MSNIINHGQQEGVDHNSTLLADGSVAQIANVALVRNGGSRRRNTATDRKQPQRLAVLAALILVTVSAPLMIGGGPVWAQLISVGLTLGTATLFIATRAHPLRTVPLAGAAVVGVAMTCAQLVPLPHRLMQTLSPQAVALRMAVDPAGQRFVPVTLDVPATVIEVAKGVAYLALLLITAAVTRRSSGARPLLITVALLGGSVAAITLFHRVFDLSRIYGLYVPKEHPGLGFFPPFVNGNQAAALFVLSSLIALGLAIESLGIVRWLSVGSLVTMLFVLPMTGARAGFVGMAVGGTGLGAGLLARRFGWPRAILIAAVLVALACVPAVLGSQVLRERLGGGMTSFLHNQKTRGWRDAVAMVSDYRVTGVGRGAFEAPIARYRQNSEGIRLSYPEMLPLQLASEWGLPFLLVIAIFTLGGIVKTAPWVLSLETSVQAAAFGLLAIVTQEFANFSFELTGVAIPAVVALGIVVGRSQERRDPRRLQGRKLGLRILVPALAFAATAFVGALWAYPRTLWAEGENLRRRVAAGTPSRQELQAAALRHPSDQYIAMLAHLDEVPRDQARAQHHLDRAMRLFPADGTLAQMSARWLVKLGRTAQAALAYRQAAEHGMITSRDELLAQLGHALVAEAVPQTQDDLMAVARLLVTQQQLDQAAQVSGRAVDVAVDKEQAAVQRVALATQTGVADFSIVAAEDLLLVAQNPPAFITAAEAFAKAGDNDAADHAIRKGLKRHPQEGTLVLSGARLQFARGAFAEAMALLRAHPDRDFALADQIQVQQLKAQIAEGQGDLMGAVTARSRARALLDMSRVTAH